MEIRMSITKQLDGEVITETNFFIDVKIEKTIKIIEYLEKEIEDVFQAKFDNNLDGFNPLIAYFIFDLLDYVRQNRENYNFSKKVKNFEEKLSKIFEGKSYGKENNE